MNEKTHKLVTRVLEKLVSETPIEKVLIMDGRGELVNSFPSEIGDEDLARVSFEMAHNCIIASRGLGMGDPTKVELGSKGNSLLMVGVDQKYLVTLKARGKIDEYMLLATVIKLFHEYELGTRVSDLAIPTLTTK